jgi:hypothetical protein
LVEEVSVSAEEYLPGGSGGTLPGSIAVHAGVLESDARVLAECAERLRGIADRLDAYGAAPGWLRETMHAHLAACAAASGDLAAAASRLHDYADRAHR